MNERRFGKSPPSVLLADKLTRLGIREPATDLVTQYGENLYVLRTTQRERLERYFGALTGSLDERELARIYNQIAFAHLDLPLFGIEEEPVYLLSDTQNPRQSGHDESGAAVIGGIFPKRDKPFTADSIFNINFEQDIERIGRTSINIIFIADGATMMIPSDLWPEEVKAASAIKNAAKSYPDCFWTAGWNALLGNSLIPTPPDFAENKAIQQAHEQNLNTKIRQFVTENMLKLTAQEMAQHILLKMINPALGRFLSKAFPYFDSSNVAYYPSGIGGVIININPYTARGLDAVLKYSKKFIEHSALAGFCTVGDIAIAQGREGERRYKLVNDPYQVDRHDKALNQLLGRNDSQVVARIAQIRAPFTGNLQGFSPDRQGIQTGFLDFERGIFAYTDGLRLSAAKLLGRTRRENWISMRFDATASSFGFDPSLAILERRLQGYKGVRADDGSFIRIDPYNCRPEDLSRLRNSPFLVNESVLTQ